MSTLKNTLKSTSNRALSLRRLILSVTAGALLVGVSVLGSSLSSALSPSSVDRPYSYDCAGSTTRVTPPDLGQGDTQTITVTGTGCGTMDFVLGSMFTPGDPVLTKNGTPVALGTSTSVSAGDVFVLTAQSAGSGFGRLEFVNTSQDLKIFDWVVDSSIVNSSTTTAPAPSTTVNPGGGSSSGDASGVTSDLIAPAFTG
jgi:hypothetical protein